MADINIERKGSSIWPWIVGLLVLAVVVWVVMQYFQGNDDAAGMPADSATVQQPVPQYSPAPAPAVPAPAGPGDSLPGDSVPPAVTTGM